MYTAVEIIEMLREWGFELFVGDDGVVHGKRPGGVTLEMRPVIEQLQALNDEVAEILKKEIRYDGISVDQACRIGEDVRDGHLELVGKVVYHRRTDLCDMTVRPR